MRFLLTLSALLLATPALAESIRLLVQSSPLAGSQYYAVTAQWEAMRVGDQVTLIREPDNRHDRKAVRVEWRSHKLGYLPRAENGSVAAAMDAGERVVGRISRLRDDPNPWRRVEIEVYVEL